MASVSARVILRILATYEFCFGNRHWNWFEFVGGLVEGFAVEHSVFGILQTPVASIVCDRTEAKERTWQVWAIASVRASP